MANIKAWLIALAALVAFPGSLHAQQASLKGSKESMALQNSVADKMGLVRVYEDQLESLKEQQVLVQLPEEEFIKVDGRLSGKYRWCLPSTRDFLIELGRDFHDRFGVPLRVTSAVRSIEYQNGLILRNGNAARGDTPDSRSSHLTGATVDITKRGLTQEQLVWLRARLTLHEYMGRAEVTEEFQQPVFHIMVLPSNTSVELTGHLTR